LRIFLPCWLHFFETPTKLYRKARLGNLDALDIILRIDKRVIEDTKIARHFAQHGTDPASPNFKQLIKALEGAPRKISVTKVKTFLAAFLYGLSKSLGSPQKWVHLVGPLSSVFKVDNFTDCAT